MNGRNEDHDNRDSATNANTQQNAGDEQMATQETPRFTSPVHITFHHTRKRLADIDNLCGKGVLDQIVRAGILSDDTPEHVQKVSHTQVKGFPEKTEVIIEVITPTQE